MLLTWFIKNILRPRWVVCLDEEYGKGDMALRILGRNLYYYKWDDPLVLKQRPEEYKIAGKREFGTTVKSQFMDELPEVTT
ncbi:MAG: hypothetical protein WCY09_08190 [Candidatus Omnitrophota bacterium]